MAHYVVLVTYTDQGLKGVKDTVKRAEAAREMASKAGLTMKETYWTLGEFDVVALFEAPDDEQMTAFALTLSRQGNIKTRTLRAFQAKEMSSLLSKVH